MVFKCVQKYLKASGSHPEVSKCIGITVVSAPNWVKIKKEIYDVTKVEPYIISEYKVYSIEYDR